jgi:hypothetical protein
VTEAFDRADHAFRKRPCTRTQTPAHALASSSKSSAADETARLCASCAGGRSAGGRPRRPIHDPSVHRTCRAEICTSRHGPGPRITHRAYARIGRRVCARIGRRVDGAFTTRLDGLWRLRPTDTCARHGDGRDRGSAAAVGSAIGGFFVISQTAIRERRIMTRNCSGLADKLEVRARREHSYAIANWLAWVGSGLRPGFKTHAAMGRCGGGRRSRFPLRHFAVVGQGANKVCARPGRRHLPEPEQTARILRVVG